MSAAATRTPVAVLIGRARAISHLARRLAKRPESGWEQAPYGERRAVASRLLCARLRLNRAGLLRWRVVAAEEGWRW